MTARDVAITRGIGDSLALRLACHDPAVHRAHAPEGKNARAIFDAVEQARVEALGSIRMSGVAKNLNAMLEDRYHRGNYQDVTDRADAPLEDAVALMVRERLTGEVPPASSRKVVDLWRDWIEERAGKDFSRLGAAIDDQGRFAGAVRDILASLDMADELGSEGDDEEGDEGDTSEPDESEGASESEEGSEASNPEESESASDETEAGEGESSEADAD
jgi:cobaltochelatase CobT